MIRQKDEGFNDEDEHAIEHAHISDRDDSHKETLCNVPCNVQQSEELIFELLASLPRSDVAKIHRSMTRYLHMDLIGMLPSELALQVFSYLSWECLLKSALVCRRWRVLANDPALWKRLCQVRGWRWKQPNISQYEGFLSTQHDEDDEGMGDDEEEYEYEEEQLAKHDCKLSLLRTSDEDTHDAFGLPASPRISGHKPYITKQPTVFAPRNRYNRHSAPSILPTLNSPKPDYKLLHQTHILLTNRILHGSYRVSTLQMRGTKNAHTSTIYCLQLFTYSDGRQVLFTGSKDKTVREWDLNTASVGRVFEGVHTGSVLSLCVHGNWLATAGSDWVMNVWDLRDGKIKHTIQDHEDSVLCVRFDEKRLVSCSKDRTIRTFLFPDLHAHLVLDSHRAAVNAIAISGDQIVSASGDKSLRIWDANNGSLLRIFERYHTRGIASIDFEPPFILSGSSDKHIRLVDLTTQYGWSTCPEFHNPATDDGIVCDRCGRAYPETSAESSHRHRHPRYRHPLTPNAHEELVRSVVLGPELVVSGSYDQSIKVWDRKTGMFVTDLAGAHEGRIFCVGFDCTKVVSCGEDQKICIWDFAHDIDTSFVAL